LRQIPIMNASFLKELQELVKANVISQQTADDIHAFYQSKKTENNSFPIILSILGSILVALGIILVIAHNWDQFGRGIKTAFAFLPLILSQALCFFVLLRKKQNIGWKESAATLLFFSVGACISLVSQIYHISGTLSQFLLTWMFLAIPLVYFFSSFVVTLLYIGGITWYACVEGYGYGNHVPYWYFILLLLLAPAYIRVLKSKPSGNAMRFFNWFLALSFAISFGTLAKSSGDYHVLFAGYLGLFCLYYLIGTLIVQQTSTVLGNSFFSVGLTGILFILITWSFDWLWESPPYDNPWLVTFSRPLPYITAIIFLLIGYLLFKRFKEVGAEAADPVPFSAYFFALAVTSFYYFPTAGVLVVNFWVLSLALYYIRKGSIRSHLGILNFGLLIVTVLAVFRFFDDSIPFIWRGMIFLLTGIGIFAANLIIIKRKKLLSQKTQS
jgi:hypothetical protein